MGGRHHHLLVVGGPGALQGLRRSHDKREDSLGGVWFSSREATHHRSEGLSPQAFTALGREANTIGEGGRASLVPKE